MICDATNTLKKVVELRYRLRSTLQSRSEPVSHSFLSGRKSTFSSELCTGEESAPLSTKPFAADSCQGLCQHRSRLFVQDIDQLFPDCLGTGAPRERERPPVFEAPCESQTQVGSAAGTYAL